jgi:kynurenine formamidase
LAHFPDGHVQGEQNLRRTTVRFIDLSVPLDDDQRWAPWWARTHVRHQNHRFGRLAIWLLFRLSPHYLRSGLGWANDVLKLSTHGTTHLDAPWHYAPWSEGKRAKTIDQIPLDWCYGHGVVLDLRHKRDGEAIQVDDVQTALAQIHYTLQPMDIVLIHTGNDRLLGTPAYFTHGTGMSAAATRWILDQGVKVTGIDSWGWDLPLPTVARRAKASGRRDLFWEAHFVGIDKEYCHLERLTHLDQLPPFGFTVCCFPLKVHGGSAGPCRVVAILEDERNP